MTVINKRIGYEVRKNRKFPQEKKKITKENVLRDFEKFHESISDFKSASKYANENFERAKDAHGAQDMTKELLKTLEHLFSEVGAFAENFENKQPRKKQLHEAEE